MVHYRLRVPEGERGPITLTARLNYRKLDTTYLRHIQGDRFVHNDLPILTLAEDRVTLPVAGGPAVAPPPEQPADGFPAWQRWNDYGIGLLRKPRNSQLRQAEEAFARLEALGHGDGALNLARVYLADGRLHEAALALERASQGENPALPWTATWIGALVDRQNGYLDQAIAGFETILDTRFAEARRRGFDFSQDYRVLNALGETLYERARQERGEARRGVRERFLRAAAESLRADPGPGPGGPGRPPQPGSGLSGPWGPGTRRATPTPARRLQARRQCRRLRRGPAPPQQPGGEPCRRGRGDL